MIMSLDKATTMFCPYGFAAKSAKFCMGSSCMAWRWTDKKQIKGYCGACQKPVELKEIDDDGK